MIILAWKGRPISLEKFLLTLPVHDLSLSVRERYSTEGIKMNAVKGWKRHRKDGNNGKGGFVAGNRRYRRNARKGDRADRTMGRARNSCN